MINQFNVSLWGDEAWAATLAVKPIAQIISIVARDTSPPLYYLLDHLWMKLFGTSEVSIRTLCFFFFLGTIFFVYLIGKHLWDEKTGLWAAGLTLANPFLFKYAFEGRMYALLALTVAASMYFYLKKNRLGYIISSAAALYTHHFAIFAIIVQAGWHLFQNLNQKPKKLIASFRDFFIIGLVYLPWLYPLYYQTSLVGSGFWLGKPTAETVLDVIGAFILGPEKSLLALKSLGLACLVFILLTRKWLKENSKTLFLILWFLFPIALTFIVSQFFQSIFFDRYLLFVIPGVLLILASNLRKASFLPLAVFLMIMLFVNFHYFTHPAKRSFRSLAILIQEKIKNHDFLINYNAAAHHLFESKYYGLKAPIYAPGNELPFYVGTALMEEEDIVKNIPPGVNRLGVITSGSLEEVEIRGFQMLAAFEVGDLKFARFVPVQ
jgi:hypothetical protein